MSLKTFHFIFIMSAIALALGCGIWELKNYWSPGGRPMDLAVGIGSTLAAVGLIIYERYFLKKLKDVSYL